jgi:hypothetical protein
MGVSFGGIDSRCVAEYRSKRFVNRSAIVVVMMTRSRRNRFAFTLLFTGQPFPFNDGTQFIGVHDLWYDLCSYFEDGHFLMFVI